MNLFREPVGNTCPNIDKIIEYLNEVLKICEKSEGSMDDLEQIKWQISDIPDMLEDLRDANSTLRNWGFDLIELCKDKDKEIEELLNELNK